MTATTPNNRTPDELQLLTDLKARVATIEALMVARSGRVPHVAADPAAPPDGAAWVRSDNGEMRWRSNGVTYPTDWTPVTFTNSWVNFGGVYNTCQYRKVGDIVYLRGLMSSGTIGLASFTLPAGFRPPADLYFSTVSNNLFGSFILQSNGVFLTSSGSNVWFSINREFSASTI